MAWSANFIENLGDSSIVPQYHLHFLNLLNCAGGELNIYSTGGGSAQIDASGPIVQGSRVIPQSWSVSFGGFSVPIVGDIRPALSVIRKGQFAELKCALNSGYQRISIGQLRAISGGPVNWIFEFTDMLSALQNSHDAQQNQTVGSATIELQSPFFYMAGIETSATAWNAGTLELSVDNVLPYKRESGENGLAKLVNGGVTKYYSFSSGSTTVSPAGILQIVTQDTYPTIDTASLAPATSKVYPVARLQGYPGDIMAKIILSDTTGSFGTYPDDWGVGGGLSGLVDTSDIAQFRSAIKTSTGGAYTWELIVDDPWASGFRDLCSIASTVGQWPVWRQNQLSWRGCVKLSTASAPSPSASITESDIFSIERNDIFDTDVSSVIPGVSIKHSIDKGGAAYTYSIQPAINSLMSSLPAKIRSVVDGSRLYNGTPYTTGGRTSRSEAAAGDADRLSEWNENIYQKITLRCALKFAGLVPGDLVEITCRYLFTPDDGSTGFFNNRLCMVLGVDYSISEAWCNLTITTK